MQRNNRTRRARTPRSNNRRNTSLSSVVKGQKLEVNADPTSFVGVPWYPLSVNHNGERAQGSSFAVSPSYIYTLMQAQLGITQKPEMISLRLLEVRLWNVSGDTIVLEPLDLTLVGKNDFTTHLIDYPGRNQWARVGYKWPSSQQQVLFSGTDTNPLFKVRCQGIANATQPSHYVLRVNLLWTFRVDTDPAFAAPSVECLPLASDEDED